VNATGFTVPQAPKDRAKDTATTIVATRKVADEFEEELFMIFPRLEKVLIFKFDKEFSKFLDDSFSSVTLLAPV
jgi:hypothetical protein